VEVEHLWATPVGGSVTVAARLSTVDGRRLSFTIEARDGDMLAGRGLIERVLVDRERFVAKAVHR
jgi:predicted thioesterase